MSDLISTFRVRLGHLSAHGASRCGCFLLRKLSTKRAKVLAYQASRANAGHLSGAAGTLQAECSISAPECAISTQFPPSVCIPSTALIGLTKPFSSLFSVPSAH